jgi:hypothetical protein
MSKTEKEARKYTVLLLLDKGESDPADGLLGHSEAYQRVCDLQRQIAAARAEMAAHVGVINTALQNEWMVGVAKTFARKKSLRAASHFELDETGLLTLICDKIDRVVTKKYTHKAARMSDLRARGTALGIDVDKLGLGRERCKIASHLDEAEAQRKRIATQHAKMFRTGDATVAHRL